MPRGIYEHKKGYKRPEFAKKISGEKHWNWKGKAKSRKYIMIKNYNHPFARKDKYILEHRLVIEKQIGRYLHTWEIAHHINKIKSDNRPGNLMAFKSKDAHNKFEEGININPSDIIFDGRKLQEGVIPNV